MCRYRSARAGSRWIHGDSPSRSNVIMIAQRARSGQVTGVVMVQKNSRAGWGPQSLGGASRQFPCQVEPARLACRSLQRGRDDSQREGPMPRRARRPKTRIKARRPAAGKSSRSLRGTARALEKRLAESLEREKATGDVLRVISRSPADLPTVLQTIAETAARVCGASDGVVFLTVGTRLRIMAHHGAIGALIGEERDLDRATVAGRAAVDRMPGHVPDLLSESSKFPVGGEMARRRGFRTSLAVPLLRDGVALGSLLIRRTEVRPFTDKQIELLQTFADQAVIAIENARLFKELEEKNRALTTAHSQVTEALEQQTATAEILRVISRSQTDVQPVFDTIVRNAVSLCHGLFGAIFQFDGELIHRVAQHKYTTEALEESDRIYPVRPTRALGSGRTILERAVLHIPDVEADPEHQHRDLSRAIGFRSGLWVPMLREGAPIGVIAVTRAEPGRFSDNEIELLKTFADQAVIAVENVRLFKELQARTSELTQSVEKLTALGEVSRAVSSTLEVETVLETIVSRASQLAEGAGSAIYEYDEATGQFELRTTYNYSPEYVEALRAIPL